MEAGNDGVNSYFISQRHCWRPVSDYVIRRASFRKALLFLTNGRFALFSNIYSIRTIFLPCASQLFFTFASDFINKAAGWRQTGNETAR
jgi:hypothetical protein